MAGLFDDLIPKKADGSPAPPAPPQPAPVAPAPAPAPAAPQPDASAAANDAVKQKLIQSLGSQPAAPQASDLGTTALWNKPPDASWGNYMLAHLSKPFQGANQAADDYSRVIDNAFTANYADRLQASLNGTTPAQEKALTDAAHARLGAMDPIASGIGVAANPALRLAGGKLGYSPLSLAGQGAAWDALSATGSGDNPVPAAGVGAVTGLGLGALGQAFSPVVRAVGGLFGKSPAAVTGAAQDAQQQAENAMAELSYPRKAVGFEAGSGTRDQTAADLLNTREWLKTVRPEDDPSGAGPILQKKIDQALTQATPTGGTPGQGQAAVDAATAAAQRTQDAMQLQKFSQMPGAQVRDEATKLAQAAELGSPRAAAYGDIAAAPTGGGAPGWYNYVVKPAITAGGGVAGGYISPGIGHMVGAGAGQMVGEAASNLFPSGGGRELADAIARNYPALTGQASSGTIGLQGQQQLGEALRTLLLSQGGKKPNLPTAAQARASLPF